MKKIMTAINNPILNEKLSYENNIELIGKDIQYKEAILEILENNEIDILILSENLPGEINIFDLIKFIKKKEIKIIFIIEKENFELEKNLKEEHVDLILYNNKITIKSIVDIIKNEELNSNENLKKEIEILKEMVLKNGYKDSKKHIKIIKEKLIKIIPKNDKKNDKFSQKIITFFGDDCVGKTTIISIFIKILLKKYQKILMINLSEKNNDIFLVFGDENSYDKNIKSEQEILEDSKKDLTLFEGKSLIENEKLNEKKFKHLIKEFPKIFIEISIHNNKNINKKILEISDEIIFISQTNINDISKSRKILQEFFNNDFIKKEKVKIIFNKYNKYSIDEKILKNIFNEFNIIGKIKNNLKYNKLFNNNLKFINKKIIKENEKILNEFIDKKSI